MKITLTILLLIFNSSLFGQADSSRNFVGLHFGGQALVGWSYDRTLINKNFFRLNAAAGVVINEYADDLDPSDRAIYGINLGIIALYDVKVKYVFIENGFYSSPYFYKSLTFINYYGWFGLRINSEFSEGLFATIGWTPSFYFSKTPPKGYNNVRVGIKLGINF